MARLCRFLYVILLKVAGTLYQKKMSLSVYPSPNTDYQLLTKKHPCRIRVLSVYFPYI